MVHVCYGRNRLRLWPKLWYGNIIQFILNQTNLWVVSDLLGLGGVFYSKLMWLEIISSSNIDLLVLLNFDRQTIPQGKQQQIRRDVNELGMMNEALLLGYIFRVQ
mgnify:CR=1 FL=1